MYYEEKMVGGRLMCRHHPDEKFVECPIDKAWNKITELQDKVKELTACMQTIKNMADTYT